MTDESTFLRISHYTASTAVLGPGNRFVIWTQGCRKRCRNCINPQGQELEGGYMISVRELVGIIQDQKDIQGITISGGEPLLQVQAVHKLVTMIRESTSLDIMLYSGYQYEKILEFMGLHFFREFFRQIDIFVDSEYREEEDHGEIFRGSGNQHIYYFTPKYQEFAEQIQTAHSRNIEFEVEESEIYMIGIPPKGFYKEMLDAVIRETDK